MDALVGMDVWQLYEGDAGRRAMEMAESFVAIGLKREAAALRKINAAFPGSAPSADSDERERQN